MPISLSKRLRIYARDGYRCQDCGFQTTRERVLELIEQARENYGRFPRAELLTLDHIVPLARGGSNDERNLQTLCSPCNQRKGCKVPAGKGAVKKKPPPNDEYRRLGERPVAFSTLGYMARIEGARHQPGCDPIFGCVGHCLVKMLGHPQAA